MATRLHRLAIVLLGCLVLGASCGQTGLTILPGVVNDPSNRTLRREIFRFATAELCREMKQRSVPLKLRDADPSIGRFFPTRCDVRELGNEKNLFVQLSGHGYAWNDVTGRLGFEASAAVEYEHDFLVEGSAMYVYFRQRHTQNASFRPLMVQKAGGAVDGVAGVLGTDVQAIADQVGARILEHQLARGFTVVRESDGEVRFKLGVVERGETIFAPFGRGESDWEILANDRVELHGGQVDLTGPYTVTDEDEALWLTAMVEGAPAVDLLVFGRATADPWIRAYERQARAPQLPRAYITDRIPQTQSAAGRRPAPYRRPLVLPPGQYYVAFDNSRLGGSTAPTSQALDDRSPLVSYALQLGDPP